MRLHQDCNFLVNVISEALEPDPSMTVDKWSDEFMIIPKSSGSNEYGKYRTNRTPHARAIMLALSDSHPCKRVVCQVASQMFKTQIALNWFAASVHQSPSNFLWLMPTGKLHKRIAARIDKTIDAVDVLRERVAKPKSREQQNNLDTKEYIGGALFIATAGASANLSEVPARRVAFDEVDRAEANVNNEGDPIKLAEARQTTFKHNKKAYYYSSPTIEGESKINELYKIGTQQHALAECIHCGAAQDLIFEQLTDDSKYPCTECGGLHDEPDKPKLFKNGLWSEPIQEGDTYSFTASAMFLPYGWTSWAELKEEYNQAVEKLDAGDETGMIVFYNTRLARCWERKKEQTSAIALQRRAEDYKLNTIPSGGYVVTASVDTQDDRFEYKAVAWGVGMECWVIDYRVIFGSPGDMDTRNKLDEVLKTKYTHESGAIVAVSAAFIDSGGHFTQDIYDFCRGKQFRHIYAIKGENTPSKPILSKKTKVDVNAAGKYVKKGLSIWMLGTDTAKDLIMSRLSKTKGRGVIHFSADLEEDYYKQLTAEYRTTRVYRGRKVSSWGLKDGDRNEALDLMVYGFAAAYYLGLHKLTERQWQNRKPKVYDQNAEPEKNVRKIKRRKDNSKFSL